MKNKVIFDHDLIKKHDVAGPRYTSYPTAVEFNGGFQMSEYCDAIEESNSEPIPAPLSLYLHIPFCNTVCYYCACNKIVTKNTDKAASYVELLKKEIVLQAALFDGDRKVFQMHWGGGTPSYLNDEKIDDVFKTVRDNFLLNDDDTGEYGIEIDPRTVDKQRIFSLRELGFNRISIGVQDFNKGVQQAINRVHSTELIRDIAQACRQAIHQIYKYRFDVWLAQTNLGKF